MRRIQTSAPVYAYRTITAVGDSQVFNKTYGVLGSQFFPTVLGSALGSQYACAIKARNFGISGQTTAEILARAVGCATQYDTPSYQNELPDLVILNGGVNDPINFAGALTPTISQTGGSINVSSGSPWIAVGAVLTFGSSPGSPTLVIPASAYSFSAATSTGQISIPSYTQQSATQVQYFVSALGYASSVAALAGPLYPAGSAVGFVSTVAPAQAVSTLPTSGTTFSTYTTTTQANIQATIAALLGAGITKIQYYNVPYRNFSSAYSGIGDNVLTSTFWSTAVTIRSYQSAACASFASSNPGQVLYSDVFTYMADLIVANNALQGEIFEVGSTGLYQGVWNVWDGNQHLNAAGHAVVAAKLLADIAAQNTGAWLSALQSTAQ